MRTVRTHLSSKINSHCSAPLHYSSPFLAHTPWQLVHRSRFHSVPDYETAFKQAQENPAEFWAKQAQGPEGSVDAVTWFKPPANTLDTESARWFAGGETNLCYNAIDRHILAGHGAQTALIFDSPVTAVKRSFTYNELAREVGLLAHVMRNRFGAVRGDVVMLYMPMVPEAIFAMLACARLGCTHVVTFGGFAGPQLATRIEHARPKILFTCSNGYAAHGKKVPYHEHIFEALELSKHKVEHCSVLVREYPNPLALPEGGKFQSTRMHDWIETVRHVTGLDKSVEPRDNFRKPTDYSGSENETLSLPSCVSVDARETAYILYTSGTTGEPKGIVRDVGGLMVSLLYSMRHVFGVKPGETFFAASDIGWVVGHSYIVYGPLLNRCTTVLYEGRPVGTPDAGALFRACSEHKVGTIFCAPTAMRMVKKEDPEGLLLKQYDTSRLRSVFLAGERSDPATLAWVQERLPHVSVVDNYWQTETGFPMVSNYIKERTETNLAVRSQSLFPSKPGSATKPTPGFVFRCLDDDGVELPPSTLGHLVVRLPLPPGCFPTLHRNPEKFVKSYLQNFPGYYETGDSGLIDEDGYVFVMTRTDDIINVNGVRISTGAIEEVLLENKRLAECAVVGIDDPMAGEIPVALVVTSNHENQLEDSELFQELTEAVRHKIGRFTHIHLARVSHLPKTRSGKILRNVIRNLGNGKPPNVPATIEDASVVDDIKDVIDDLKEKEERKRIGKE